MSFFKNPKCIICGRKEASYHGECFITIPCQLNKDGGWQGTNWYAWCGNCFTDLCKEASKIRPSYFSKNVIQTDFMNLFLEIPITVWKVKKQLTTFEVGKNY